MGNFNKQKKKQLQESASKQLQEYSSKQLLTESRKLFTDTYSAFQLIPEANNYNSIQIKQPSHLNKAIDSRNIINYVLNIYSEVIPRQNQANTTIYIPFSLIKIQNTNNPSDFLTHQILSINNFAEKATSLKKSATNPFVTSSINKQLDEIEHHVSSIKISEGEHDYNNSISNSRDKGNENDEVLLETKKTKKKKIKLNNSVQQYKSNLLNNYVNNINTHIGNLNSNQMTLKPDDQVTVSSLLQQMTFRKSNNQIPKKMGIEKQSNQMSPDIFQKNINTRDAHSIKSEHEIIGIMNPEKINDKLKNNRMNNPKTMILSPHLKKSNTMQFKFNTINSNNNNGNKYQSSTQHNEIIQSNLNDDNNRKEQHDKTYKLKSIANKDIKGNKATITLNQYDKDNNYKVCNTEPTKSNRLMKKNKGKSPNYHNRLYTRVNKSHICDRYFKSKKEIEEEEIIRKYCSRNNQRNSKSKIDKHYQITIDLRKIESNTNEEVHDDKEEEFNLNICNNQYKQPPALSTLNKLITFSPTEVEDTNLANMNMNASIPKKHLSNKSKPNEIDVSPRSYFHFSGMPSNSRIMQLK